MGYIPPLAAWVTPDDGHEVVVTKSVVDGQDEFTTYFDRKVLYRGDSEEDARAEFEGKRRELLRLYRKMNGFTVVELLIVTLLISSILAISWPSVAKFQKHQRIIGESVRVVSACRLAQARSLSTLANHEVRFYPARNAYSVWRVDWVAGVRDETLISPEHKLDPRVKIVGANFFGLRSVTFYPDGTASATGTATLYDGRETWKIGVLGGTGKSTVTAVR